ncbi:alpha/beta hydrolase [Gordonia zhaorongruii]|uniref:alpha/beta hydrolase n=1 Tax=Gordonia zhaorongruii TaxID=2597659 RepID=UPI0010496C56|nr:alpha/beta hydrolase [Gordonia zhaorongruii]
MFTALSPSAILPVPELNVLVLPGGTDFSYRPFSPFQPSALRMYPFTASIAARFGPRVRVHQTGYRVRGWNGGQASPMPYARHALTRLTRDHPDIPVAIVGHSMGGRIAALLGADERVTDILALAPWWQFADWRRIHDDARVLAVHGDADRVTRSRRTEKGIRELVERGVDATYIRVPGGAHPMLDHLGLWHSTALSFISRALNSAATAEPTGVADPLDTPETVSQ